MICPICGGELYPTYPDPTYTSCKNCGERFTVSNRRYKKGAHWISTGENEWRWVVAEILTIKVKG